MDIVTALKGLAKTYALNLKIIMNEENIDFIYNEIGLIENENLTGAEKRQIILDKIMKKEDLPVFKNYLETFYDEVVYGMLIDIIVYMYNKLKWRANDA